MRNYRIGCILMLFAGLLCASGLRGQSTSPAPSTPDGQAPASPPSPQPPPAAAPAPGAAAPAAAQAPSPAAQTAVPPVEVSREDAFAGRLALKLYNQIRAGKVNPALLTPEMQAQLTPEKLAEIKPELDALGEPAKLAVTSHKAGSLGTTYECLAVFAATQLHIQMYLTVDSKVGGYFIKP